MKFMSNTTVFIVIAALAAYAVGAALPGGDNDESTGIEQGGLRLRLRRVCTSVCGPYGCQINCQRMKRDDLATLDAALGVYEDVTSEQSHRARRSSDADSAEETAAEEPLQLRLRRVCTSVCGPYGCQINCQRMKRDDLATMDAAMAVYEDETSTDLRARRSSDAEETAAEESLQVRLRRTCTSVCGPYGCQINCQRMKREDLSAIDAALSVEESEPLQVRLRRVCTSVCGPYGCQINCQRMKREDLATMDAALGVYEETSEQTTSLRARRSSDADSAEETAAEESLQVRLRRVCTSVCGPYGCQINCQRMKREDLATLDAALGVYEANDNAMVLRARRQGCMYGIGADGKPFSICGGSSGNAGNNGNGNNGNNGNGNNGNGQGQWH